MMTQTSVSEPRARISRRGVRRTMALTTALLLVGLAHPRAFQDGTPADPYQLLHALTPADGVNPTGALVQDADGTFYGTALQGGDQATNCGTVFKMDGTGTVTVLHAFTASDGCGPVGALLHASDGHFYGMTNAGGASGTNSNGTVFRIDADGSFAVVHDFFGGAQDGSNPFGSLIQGTDGALYGTTLGGGAASGGTAFKIDLSGGFTILHSFGVDPSDGIQPWAGLIQASDGNFYGTTVEGGNPNPPECGCNDRIPAGTVFMMDSSGNVTIRYNFSGSDGSAPYAPLVDVDGVLYGTTSTGGEFADSSQHPGGVLFAMPLDDKLEVVHAFGGDPSVGEFPLGGLIKGTDGNLYGTTNYGGPQLGGTVFKVDSNVAVTALHAFEFSPSGTPAQPGSGPMASLLQASDGQLYGTASGLIGFFATGDPGVLFRVSVTAPRQDQTIDFGALGDRTFGDAQFSVTATASSSLPVTFGASGNCSVDSGLVTLTGAGSCTITASQAGNDTYNAAPDVPRTFNIAKASATLSLGNLVQAADGSPKSVTVTTNPAGLSGVSVTYNGSSAAPTQPGSYAVVASLVNADYQASNATGTLTLTGPSSKASVAVSPASVTGGSNVTGTVTLTSAAPSAGAVVQLSSSAPAVASVPASVSIAKGKTTQTFTIKTFGTSSATNVIISATYASGTATTLLVVNPATLTSVSVSPASVVGGASSTGTVTLSAPAPTGGASITLASSQGAAQVTSSVLVPAGQTSAHFTIATSPVSGSVTAAISATYLGTTRSANLSIAAASVSKLMLSPATVAGGASSTATVTLTGPAPAGGLVVAITSDKPGIVPNTNVTVAAGSTTGSAAITTTKVSARTSVVITATGGGASKTATLTVTK